jgi:hypothetical protein
MAIKVTGNTVITDTLELQNITDTDQSTAAAINNAIKSQGNVLTIYDSQGTAVRVFYGAAETPL